MSSLDERAMALLRIHEGACCVEEGSELHLAFTKYEIQGLVRFQKTTLLGTSKPMVNVYASTWIPKVAPLGEKS